MPTLTSNEWKVCKELCLILKPFEEVTKAVNGDKYMSASLVIILENGLKAETENMYNKDFDINVSKVILEMKNGLNQRLTNLEQCYTLTICTFLDPRFKQLPLSENTANQTKTKIINATANIKKNKTDNQPDQIASNTSNDEVDNDKFSIWNSFDSKK